MVSAPVAEALDIPVPFFPEIGTTKIARPDFTEILPEVTQPYEARRIYQTMQFDPTVGGILFAIEMALRQTEWYVEPASSANVDRARARFVEECMEDMSLTWEDFVADVLTMLPFGFSYFETVYKFRDGPFGMTGASKYRDGKVGWRKFAVRPQVTIEKWEIDGAGGIHGAYQRKEGAEGVVFIPITRSLHFRTRHLYNEPEGRSILVPAYRPWYFKKRYENLEGIGVERGIGGIPVGWAPPQVLTDTTSPEAMATKAALEQVLTGIRTDEESAIIWPLVYDANGKKMYDLTVLGDAQTQVDINPIIERLDRRIAGVVLAQFLFSGQDRTGAFSKQVADISLWLQALDSWARSISSVLNRFEIPRLAILNGWDTDRLPRVMAKTLDEGSARESGDLLARLGAMGVKVFPDDELEDAIRARAKWPARSEGKAPWQQQLPAKGIGGQDKLNPQRDGGGKVGGDGATAPAA